MEPLDSLSLHAKEIKQHDFSRSNQNSALLLDVLISCRASDFHSILHMSQIGMQSLSWQRFWLEIVGLAQVFPIIQIKSVSFKSKKIQLLLLRLLASWKGSATPTGT